MDMHLPDFIKENYIDMYKKWKKYSTEGFYDEE